MWEYQVYWLWVLAQKNLEYSPFRICICDMGSVPPILFDINFILCYLYALVVPSTIYFCLWNLCHHSCLVSFLWRGAFPIFCDFRHVLIKRTVVLTLTGLFCPNSMNTYKKSGMLPFKDCMPFSMLTAFWTSSARRASWLRRKSAWL